MTDRLPTFLGIGVPRAGTTWLHKLLDGHPAAYVPHRRKEVGFFNKYYDRGLDWYASFFPANALAQYKAVGEVTPHYFFCPECPRRIASVSSVRKLILILRHPVERAYSYYKHKAPIDNYRGSFSGFLADYPHVIDEGFYSRHLKRYLAYFRRDQILALVYEQVFADLPQAMDEIAAFLGLERHQFLPDAGKRVVNRSHNPKWRSAYSVAARVDGWLRANDMDWLVNLILDIGVKRLFGRGTPPSPVTEETRQRFEQMYRGDIDELESLLQIDLTCWRSSS